MRAHEVYKETRHIYPEDLPAALCRHVLHLPLHFHDAVYVAICGGTHRQRAQLADSCPILLLFRAHAGSAILAAGMKRSGSV